MAGERGFTLIEMLVAMLMTSIIMTAVIYLFTSFISDNRYDGLREDAQSNAQTIIERMSRELRSAAAPSSGAATIQKAGSYDILFQTVSATPGSAPVGNAANHMWVRYCLDGNDTLWRQTTPTSYGTSVSSIPDTSACPSTSSAWVTTSSGSPCCQELNDVTNEVGGANRAVFTYGPSGPSPTSAITSVQVTVYVDRNPGLLPGQTELGSAVYLRNALQSPVALFAPAFSAGTNSTAVTLNGSASYDPNGQALTYQWYEGSGTSISCPSPASGPPASGAISGATSQSYNASFPHNTTETFALVVTNSGGLSNCYAQTVTIP